MYLQSKIYIQLYHVKHAYIPKAHILTCMFNFLNNLNPQLFNSISHGAWLHTTDPSYINGEEVEDKRYSYDRLYTKSYVGSKAQAFIFVIKTDSIKLR